MWDFKIAIRALGLPLILTTSYGQNVIHIARETVFSLSRIRQPCLVKR